MNPDIIISKPREEDLGQIYRLAKENKLDFENLQIPQFLVAYKKGMMAGFIRLKDHPDCYELSSLYVLPQFRFSGLGVFLIKELLRVSDKPLIYLVTVIPAFFEKSGFEITGTFPPSLKSKKESCKFHCSIENVSVMMWEKEKRN